MALCIKIENNSMIISNLSTTEQKRNFIKLNTKLLGFSNLGASEFLVTLEKKKNLKMHFDTQNRLYVSKNDLLLSKYRKYIIKFLSKNSLEIIPVIENEQGSKPE